MEIQSEMERQQEFEDLVGGWQRAERLAKIYQNSYPSPSWSPSLGHHQIPKLEIFRKKAKRDGYTTKEIGAFLRL